MVLTTTTLLHDVKVLYLILFSCVVPLCRFGKKVYPRAFVFLQ